MVANINDVNINYVVSGSGKDVLLLHGWGQSLNTFTSVAKQLEKKYKVYSIDLPGFGKSSIDKPLDVLENAKLIKDFCNKLNIKKPIIIAHSYGGRIAIMLENMFDIEKLILVGVPGIKPKLSLRKRISILVYKILKKFKITLNTGSFDYKNATPVLKKMLVMAVNLDLSKELKKIKVPTLLIYGENDVATPVKMAKKMDNLIPNSGLVVIPNTTHFCYLENKQYFLIVVNKFLGDSYDNSN